MAVKKLPPGYIDLGNVALHVADVRRYTEDLERFREYLPAAVKLARLEVGSQEAREVFQSAANSPQDTIDLLLTIQELASFQNRLALTVRALQSEPIIIH